LYQHKILPYLLSSTNMLLSKPKQFVLNISTNGLLLLCLLSNLLVGILKKPGLTLDLLII
jgi:hypothetical protein